MAKVTKTKIRLTATDLEKFHHKQQSIESLDTIRGVADALRPVISALMTLGSEAGYQPEKAGLYALFVGGGLILRLEDLCDAHDLTFDEAWAQHLGDFELLPPGLRDRLVRCYENIVDAVATDTPEFEPF